MSTTGFFLSLFVFCITTYSLFAESLVSHPDDLEKLPAAGQRIVGFGILTGILAAACFPVFVPLGIAFCISGFRTRPTRFAHIALYASFAPLMYIVYFVVMLIYVSLRK
jgi:hypothetical protein